MAETPNNPDPQDGSANTPAPVILDLTGEERAEEAQPKVREAFRAVAERAGEPVAEVTQQAGKDAKSLLATAGEDKNQTYAPRERAQDSARQIITLWLIGLFCVLIILAFAALFMIGLKNGFDEPFFNKLKSLLDVLLGPVITLLSSAIGFYFGYQQGAGTLNKDSAKDTSGQKPGNGQ